MIAIPVTIGILSLIVFIWATITIYIFLKEKKDKIENFVFIDFFIFKYLNEYRRITKNENGKVGSLFYVWLTSINIALFCFIIFMIFR